MMLMMMHVRNEMKRAQEAMWTKTPLVGVVDGAVGPDGVGAD